MTESYAGLNLMVKAVVPIQHIWAAAGQQLIHTERVGVTVAVAVAVKGLDWGR